MASKKTDLEKEFDNYLKHQSSFTKKYLGKVIALKDGEVLGVFDSDEDAVFALQDEHELGTFLVQRVSKGDEDTSITYYSSRVAFG